MARIVMNPAIRLISGGIDQFVYREQADGSMTVAKSPLIKPGRIPTAPEAQQRQAFKKATALCSTLQQDPAILALYQQIVKRRGPQARLRGTIIGDILKPPIINTLDLGAYHGASGSSIQVEAGDNMGVARLTLSIADEAGGQVIETAEKSFMAPLVPPPDVFWTYPTAVPVAAGHTVKVTATAYDLAGNKTEMTQTKVL